jgi:hypothetical protein
MSVIQAINLTMAFATIMALENSIRLLYFMPDMHGWALVFFFILMRLKFFADDHIYFATMENTAENRAGLLLGIFSWIFLFIAALSLPQIALAATWLMVGVGVSTIWIIFAILQKGATQEQRLWLLTNLLYLLAFYGMYRYGNAESLTEATPLLGDNHMVTGALILAYITLFIDGVLSGTLKKFLEHR